MTPDRPSTTATGARCDGLSFRDVLGRPPAYGARELRRFPARQYACRAMWLPHLQQWFVPQSLALDGATAWVSGYTWHRDVADRACRLLRVRLATGTVLADQGRLVGAPGDRKRRSAGTAEGWCRTGTVSGSRRRSGCGWSTRRASGRGGRRCCGCGGSGSRSSAPPRCCAATGSGWCTSGVRRGPGSPGSGSGTCWRQVCWTSRAWRGPDPGGSGGDVAGAGVGAGAGLPSGPRRAAGLGLPARLRGDHRARTAPRST